MKLNIINAKNIVTKSNLPDADYVINPYVGCQHGCIYCYAEFMKRFTGHTEDWGKFVDVKINATEVLGDIEKYRGKSILISSVTDGYHPIEGKYKLTRKILEALIPAQPKIEILTKARMVTRDIDILQKFDDATVGVSIATLDGGLSRELEPLAASPHLRIDTIRKCKEAGLKTYVFLSPIFPYITEIEEIIKQSKDHIDFFMFENLNLRPLNIKKVYDFIEKNRPELLEKYKQIYNKKDNSYWDSLKAKIQKLCSDCGKEARIYFHHGGFN
ncbi:radical SAM protein [Candidatus Woesearchaeota archaeon]|nr:radical SAM protein [Candidatus Woesearchaeota archaeon]